MLLNVILCSSMLYYAPQCYIMLLNVILCPSMLDYTPKFDIMIPKIMQWLSMWCHSSHLITLSTTSFLFYSNSFLFNREYVCLKFIFLIIKMIFVPKNWLEPFCTFFYFISSFFSFSYLTIIFINNNLINILIIKTIVISSHIIFSLLSRDYYKIF